MHMPISKIVIFGHFEPPTPLKTHITSWTHVILICEHSLVIFFALLSHWYPKNALKPSKITIFQKRMHMHTKIRDRGVIRERVKQTRVCVDHVLCEIRFVITPDEECVDKRFRKLTCTKKNVHNFFQSLKKTSKTALFFSKSHNIMQLITQLI